MKKIYVILAIFLMTGCAEMQQVLTNVASDYASGNTCSSINIAGGLKEALNNGIAKQVTKLTQTDGFYNNSLVRISLPDELKVVEQGLRNIGLGSLADQGIKALNTAASDAVKEATPIFVNAVSTLTFSDAQAILMGSQDAAT